MKHFPLILFAFLLFNFSALGQDDNPLFSKFNPIYRNMSYEEAIAKLTKDIEIDPNNANLFLERANNFLKLKNYEDTLSDVKSAVSLKPSDINTLREGIRILIFAGQVDEAMKIAEAIIALDNTKPIGYIARSEVKFADKDYKGAFEDVLKSYQFARLDKPLDTSRIFIFLQLFLKDNENILNYYNQVLEPIEKRMEYFAKNVPLFRYREYKEFRGWGINPDHSEYFSQIFFVYNQVIKYYESTKQLEKADEMIEKLGEYEPRYLSLFARIKFNSERKRHEKVLADLTKIIETLKEIPDFQKGVFINRGNLYVFLNKLEEAISDYKSAIALDPKLESILKEKITLAEQKLTEMKKQQK